MLKLKLTTDEITNVSFVIYNRIAADRVNPQLHYPESYFYLNFNKKMFEDVRYDVTVKQRRVFPENFTEILMENDEFFVNINTEIDYYTQCEYFYVYGLSEDDDNYEHLQGTRFVDRLYLSEKRAKEAFPNLEIGKGKVFINYIAK